MQMKNKQMKPTVSCFVVVFVSAALLMVPAVEAKKREKEVPKVTHDGLELVLDSKADAIWVRPGADFSGYDRIQILDCYVAFKKYWAQRHNRDSVTKVTNRDVEHMKAEMAELFREVFVEVLDTEGGYPVVDEADDDVLVLRPGIIDLDVTAPDTQSQGRSYSFAASAGSATLYLEIFDSVSGEILARVIDHLAASDRGGVMRWTNRVANRQAAQEVLGKWAEGLRNRLDEVHGQAD